MNPKKALGCLIVVTRKTVSKSQKSCEQISKHLKKLSCVRLELTIPRLEGVCVIQLRQQDKNEPSWVRTNDIPVNSRALYQLSYGFGRIYILYLLAELFLNKKQNMLQTKRGDNSLTQPPLLHQVHKRKYIGL